MQTSNKKILITIIIAMLVGCFGIHRFYVGKHISGFFYLFTFGWFGIGVFLDLIMLVFGQFVDGKKLPMKKWL